VENTAHGEFWPRVGALHQAHYFRAPFGSDGIHYATLRNSRNPSRASIGVQKPRIIDKLSRIGQILQRQIDTTDRQIDQFVYALYGLTDTEIKIVEAANS
jgi:hypothetical protein